MSRLLHAGSIMVVLLALSCSSLEARPPREPICGVNLVEALVLVCEHRGFFYNSKRAVDPMLGSLEKRNVVEECCHGSCNLFDLEKYCL